VNDGTSRASAFRFARCVGASLFCLLIAPALAIEAQAPPTRGLTAAPALAKAYDAILDARFDAVPALLAEACPPAPREACLVLDAVAVWWRIQLDPFNTTHDAVFTTRAEAAIAAVSAWTEREPTRAEAWLYLGGAYGARAQWRAVRGERLAAARDGKRIKQALEQALALDPSMADAYFGLGLYHYYADVAPTVLKMLRWLLLLPGGDRVLGLEEMLRARQSGQLFRSEADYQLHIVYLWYEKQFGQAISLLRDLEARHPHNPHFPQTIAEIQDFYLDDTQASLRTWEALLDAARRGRVAHAAMAETSARLGIAAQLDQLSRREAAADMLRAVIAARPEAPVGALARAHYQLGETLEHLGRRSDAASEYRRAIEAAGASDPVRIGARARTALRQLSR
jgi:tetratricopeptide (TPR) repeat protein